MFLALATGSACEFPPPRATPETWGPSRGDWGFTLGGAAVSPNLDDASASAQFDLAWFHSREIAVVLRHAGAFTDDGHDTSAMTTRVALDWSPFEGRLSPFVSPSVGFAYGESINETVTHGVHLGARYWAQPRAYLQVLAGYDLFVTRTEDNTEIFDERAFTAGFGLGILF